MSGSPDAGSFDGSRAQQNMEKFNQPLGTYNFNPPAGASGPMSGGGAGNTTGLGTGSGLNKNTTKVMVEGTPVQGFKGGTEAVSSLDPDFKPFISDTLNAVRAGGLSGGTGFGTKAGLNENINTALGNTGNVAEAQNYLSDMNIGGVDLINQVARGDANMLDPSKYMDAISQQVRRGQVGANAVTAGGLSGVGGGRRAIQDADFANMEKAALMNSMLDADKTNQATRNNALGSLGQAVAGAQGTAGAGTATLLRGGQAQRGFDQEFIDQNKDNLTYLSNLFPALTGTSVMQPVQGGK